MATLATYDLMVVCYLPSFKSGVAWCVIHGIWRGILASILAYNRRLGLAKRWTDLLAELEIF